VRLIHPNSINVNHNGKAIEKIRVVLLDDMIQACSSSQEC